MKLAHQARKWLQAQEAAIETDLRSGQELRLAVARRLREIHARFFAASAPERGALGSWESYCEQRWGFSRARGYQLLDLALVSTMVDAPDLTERQARELAGLDPAAAQAAYDSAGGPEASAAAIADAVAAQIERQAADPGTGGGGGGQADLRGRVERAAGKVRLLYRHVDLPGDGEAAELLLHAGVRLALGEALPLDHQLAELVRSQAA